MHKHIAQSAVTKTDDCCLKGTLANWTLCNLYAGCRGMEWMQIDSKQQALHSHHLNRFGNAYAFTVIDVLCATASNQLLSIQEAHQNPNNVGCIRLRYEEEVYGENGKMKLFVCHNKITAIRFVQNFMKIMLRHSMLTKAHTNLPLSVYQHGDGRICNITSVDVESFL